MNSSISQRRSFTTVLMVEMWERFGYYGMAALLVLFMIERIGFTDGKADLTWGAFAALAYATPSIGGWIGDRVLGARRTVLLGACVLSAGYLMLALPDDRLSFLYASLGAIAVGNGLFKANAANLVRRIYEGDDARIDSAFTLYYMAVNVGSTVSMLATPWIKDRWGWHAAFAVCCAGMVVGMLNFLVRYRSLALVGSAPDGEPIAWKRLGAVAAGSVALALSIVFVLGHEKVAVACVDAAAFAIVAIFAFMLHRCEQMERAGLAAAFILVMQSILFFIFYQQMSTSLTLFAVRNVDPALTLFGIALLSWSPAQFQALNPIWIMLLSPVLALAYTRFARSGADPSVAAKFALGFVAVAAAFFVFSGSGRFAVDGRVSPWFLVAGYGLLSLGELLVSGLGLAMIARYVPARMAGFMMGAYYVATGVSQYLGSVVANFAQVPSNALAATASLPMYTTLFAQLGWLAAAGALLSFLLLPLMRRLSHAHRRSLDTLAAAPMQGRRQKQAQARGQAIAAD